MIRPLVGIALQPEEVFFEHNRELIEERAELFEVTPETLWDSRCQPTDGYQRLLQLTHKRQVPVVGHGVLFSLGSALAPQRRPPPTRSFLPSPSRS